MEFWKMAWQYKAIDEEILRLAVRCESNPFGEITEDEFKLICGKDFKLKG
ncbi:XkdX family protein [Clostridium chrysemydis]|nr:XkdX family protein [Clostridium chrysemydis]